MRSGAAFACLVAASLAACMPVERRARAEAMLDMRIAAMGLARIEPDGRIVAKASGCAVFGKDGRSCLRPFTADSPVRIGSISKLVTAMGALRLAEAGKLDLDADVSAYLGFRLRNPAFPDAPITLRQIFSHTSSLRDGSTYVVPLGGDLRAELAKTEHWDAAHRPGAFYAYANLGLVVAGTAMEGASGERFDRLMTRLVFEPLGLQARYNWSGSSAAAAAQAAALYRTAGDDEIWHPSGPFLPQIDDRGGALPDCIAPARADGVACDLDAFPPGSNAGPFSPQGGLRISLNELAILARALVRTPPQAFTTSVWTLDGAGANGETDHGSVCAYATGAQLLRASQSPACRDDLFADGRVRFGHGAEAYGLLGGLWIDPADGSAVVFFATGTSTDPLPVRGVFSGFTRLEEVMASLALRLYE